MSTFMLFSRQLWKLKCYHLERWSPLRTRTSALCTSQNGEVIKTAEKTNDPDERSTLLKYKTSVSFPMRVSNQGSVLRQPLEDAAVALAEPEEIVDNSTYQNYQHHNYDPYTFADMDVEMAKYRLPQPSSGRYSPRH
ncbi:uncharacterized protein ndufv3 isoform X2 [Stigmatopora argus]